MYLVHVQSRNKCTQPVHPRPIRSELRAPKMQDACSTAAPFTLTAPARLVRAGPLLVQLQLARPQRWSRRACLQSKQLEWVCLLAVEVTRVVDVTLLRILPEVTLYYPACCKRKLIYTKFASCSTL